MFSTTLPEVDDNLLHFVDIEGEIIVAAPVHQILYLGGTVAQWLELLLHSFRDLGSIPGLGHRLCRVCMFSPCVWVSSGFSGFLPQCERCAG